MSTPTEAVATREQKEIATARRVRHMGYVVLVGTAFYLSLPLIWGAIQGLRDNHIIDPYTGQAVDRQFVTNECLEDARSLIVDAGTTGVNSARWEERFSLWTTRCREGHQDAYSMVVGARNAMRKPDRDAPQEP